MSDIYDEFFVRVLEKEAFEKLYDYLKPIGENKMKVYQVKVCVRGNPAAVQTVLIEAQEYKEALAKSVGKIAQLSNIAIGELAVADICVVEEVADKKAAENIDILRANDPADSMAVKYGIPPGSIPCSAPQNDAKEGS